MPRFGHRLLLALAVFGVAAVGTVGAVSARTTGTTTTVRFHRAPVDAGLHAVLAGAQSVEVRVPAPARYLEPEILELGGQLDGRPEILVASTRRDAGWRLVAELDASVRAARMRIDGVRGIVGSLRDVASTGWQDLEPGRLVVLATGKPGVGSYALTPHVDSLGPGSSRAIKVVLRLEDRSTTGATVSSL